MIKRTLMIFVIALFISAPAFGDGIVPESDCVGLDTANVFHGPVDAMVMAYVNLHGNTINNFSDFTGLEDSGLSEFFDGNGSTPRPDATCFNFKEYESVLVDAGNEGNYTWQIVLQVKPKTDLDLTIRDCVLEYAGTTIWGDAGQTGFYRDGSGVLWPIPGANPSITVVALPGPYSHSYPFLPGTSDPGMIMDAKRHPTLTVVPVNKQLYTSKGLWAEAIVLELPDYNQTNASGQPEVPLKQGDMINVSIDIPYYNGTDIRYSSDSVEVQYCGYEALYVMSSDFDE